MNFKEVCVAVVLRAFTAFIKFAMEVENFHLIKLPGLHPSGFHCLKSFYMWGVGMSIALSRQMVVLRLLLFELVNKQ